MSELQPGIQAEVASKLSAADALMRVAAAGVAASLLGIVGLTPEDESTILLGIMAVETLRSQKRWTEQYVKDQCGAFVRASHSSAESVATARAVLKAMEDRSGLLRAGTPEISSKDELLRPAHDAGYTDPSTLVRAAGNEAGADADTLEENKDGVGNGKSAPKLLRPFWKR